MALTGSSTYVGFGFGAIQSGLFLYEAFRSGAFGRLVVAEVVPEVVAAVRAAGGYYTVNIAHADSVEAARIGPIQIEDPNQPADRRRLIEAIALAEEIGTAIPSVALYASEGPGSLHRVLADGLLRKARSDGPRAVVYTAENHNRAAETLEDQVFSVLPKTLHDAARRRVQFLNTVIGKMSGVITDLDGLPKLVPVTPGETRAFLVETFNRILISKVRFDSFVRGLAVFEEKSDLFPFEEAKLYGHNAMHALGAYLGAIYGVEHMAELHTVPGMIPFLRAASIEESGAALIRKYSGTDPLFTKKGFAAYAEDLLVRMSNPYLRDTVVRVGRDPARKLGWDDRIIGTMRLARRHGVEAGRYALGAAAALSALAPGQSAGLALPPLWPETVPLDEKHAIVQCVAAAQQQLDRWIKAGFPDLTHLDDLTSPE